MWKIVVGVALIAVVAATWNWWRQRDGKRVGDAEEAPLHAVVLLLDAPRELTAEQLQRKAEVAWATTFPEGDDATSFVVGDPPAFVIQVPDQRFLVDVFPVPYMDDPVGFAESISEPRYRAAVAGHRAWLSVDVIDADEPGELDAAYAKIGKLIAELVDDDVRAVFATHTQRINTIDEEVLSKLRAGRTLEAIEMPAHAPMIEVAADDPRMAEAVRRANEQWPRFVEAFNTGVGEGHGVKVPISDGQNTEFIWIEVQSIDGPTVTGRLGNDPANLEGYALGDRVTVPLDELSDWNYFEDGRLVGSFTIEVLAPEMYDQLKQGSEEP